MKLFGGVRRRGTSLLDFLGAKLTKYYMQHNSKPTIYLFLPWGLEKEKFSSSDAFFLAPVSTLLCPNTDLLSTRQKGPTAIDTSISRSLKS